MHRRAGPQPSDMDVLHTSRLSSVASCSRRCFLEDGVPRPASLKSSIFSRQSCRIKGRQITCLESGPVHSRRQIHDYSHRELLSLCGPASGERGTFSGAPHRAQRSGHVVRDVSVHIRPIPALESDTAHSSPDWFAEIKAGECHASKLQLGSHPTA